MLDFKLAVILKSIGTVETFSKILQNILKIFFFFEIRTGNKNIKSNSNNYSIQNIALSV